jgi:hypothetical protein
MPHAKGAYDFLWRNKYTLGFPLSIKKKENDDYCGVHFGRDCQYVITCDFVR